MQGDKCQAFTDYKLLMQYNCVQESAADWVKLRLLLLQGNRGLWEDGVGVKATGTRTQTSSGPD